MRKEMEERGEQEAEEFKQSMFAHAFLSQNPDFYTKLFPQEFGLTAEEEQFLEWERPESEADVERLMDELRETGWGG